MRFYWEKVEASRNFANKIWNASRFILMNMDEEPTATLDELTAADRWILSKVNRLTKDVTENMEKYELGIAVAKLNDFFWEEFCDWYIEMVKSRLYNKEDSTRPAALWTLRTVLINALKLLHPYMPFITEELFSYVCPEEETIMLSSWPEFREDWDFSSEEEEIEIMKEAIRGIRNIRAQMNVSPKHKAMAMIVTSDDRTADIFRRGTGFFAPLSYTSEVVVQRDRTGVPESAVSIPLEKAVVYIPLDQLVDLAKEKARLEKERDSLSKELERVAKKLSNQGFLAKAPQAVVEEERAKEEKYKALMRQIEEQITRLGK